MAAVSDLFPDRCAALAQACRSDTTYPSLEESVKVDSLEAVFVATDAPGHARHCLEVLKHDKHVGCAVPAVFGSLEEADPLFEAVKTSGLVPLVNEIAWLGLSASNPDPRVLVTWVKKICRLRSQAI